jgi:transcriptional regulator GlxA family with amidase domain
MAADNFTPRDRDEAWKWLAESDGRPYVSAQHGRVVTVGFLADRGLTIWQQDRAIEVLNEHLDGDLALADLAKECALSASRFMRAFKRSFGVPVRRYLLYKRVEAAKSLLLHSNDSLLTVALEVGFTDQPAFNRSFREIVGTSPGRWRRANAPMPKAFNLPAPEEK